MSLSKHVLAASGDDIASSMGNIAKTSTTAAASAGTLTSTFSGLFTTLGSLAPLLGVVAASIGGLALINKFTESYSEAVSKALASAAQYAQTKGELQSVNSELSSVQARIEELQSKGKLSFTEQAELTALQAQNDALEQRSALLTKLSDAQKYSSTQDAANAMQKKSDSIIYETSGETDALMASYGGGQSEAKEMHKVIRLQIPKASKKT